MDKLTAAIKKCEADLATLNLFEAFPGAYEELLEFLDDVSGRVPDDFTPEEYIFEMCPDVFEGVLQFEVEGSHEWWCWDPITRVWFNPEDATR